MIPRFAIVPRPLGALTLSLALATASTGAFAQAQPAVFNDDLFPPNARPGECYARVWVPEIYETRTDKVLRKEASESIEIIPAQYETVQEPVLVKEATTRLETVPAVYETVTEEVVVKPAETRLEVIPAVYETVTEEVLVKAGYTTWKMGRGPIERIDTATGEIMCLVEVPPVYETVEKTVLVTPAEIREIEVPAETMLVEKEVVVEPARTVEVEVPAEYETVEVLKLKAPAREVRTPLPEEYDIVEATMKVKDGRLEWRSILCETNTTPDIIRDLQAALQAAGYDPGPADGSLGWQTQRAVQAFQEAKGLPAGELTMETLDVLGIRPGADS